MTQIDAHADLPESIQEVYKNQDISWSHVKKYGKSVGFSVNLGGDSEIFYSRNGGMLGNQRPEGYDTISHGGEFLIDLAAGGLTALGRTAGRGILLSLPKFSSNLTGKSIARQSRLVEVTSWADEGITPDLNPGRWVQLGGPSRLNFWRTGLPGPKLTFNPLSISRSKVAFDNHVTGMIERRSLQWPSGGVGGIEWIKGFFGQRIIKP